MSDPGSDQVRGRVSSSILVPIAIGVLVVLSAVRFAGLVTHLNVCPEGHLHKKKEAPMKRKVMSLISSLVETTEALGASMGAGLLLQS